MIGIICDMDGVIYRGNRAVPGAVGFVKRLRESGLPYLFLTNNPDFTPEALRGRLKNMGMDVPATHFYTSAQATAAFIQTQSTRPRIYAIGEKSLTRELEAIGAVLTDRSPDYVVVGSPQSYDFSKIEKAINLVIGGAKLIGTNPDSLGPSESGVIPGCGALIAPIEIASKRKAYFVGKPNPLMMRTALWKMSVGASQAYMIGDRMNTDVIAGIETGMKTILVLSGVTKKTDLSLYPYRPTLIFDHVGKIPLKQLL